MELELGIWLVRCWLMRPWIVTAWVFLVALTGLIPTLSNLSVRAEPITRQVVMSEAILLWGLLGGLSMLAAWGQIETQLARLGRHRRWRIRAFIALILLWLPAIPILALGGVPSDSEGGGRALLVSLAVLAQLTLTAWLAERIPWGGARSFLFLALAWWLPALATGWMLGPPGWVGRFEVGRTVSNSGFDSPVWIAWAGSMLGLLFATLGLDLVRSPHHEVRHSR